MLLSGQLSLFPAVFPPVGDTGTDPLFRRALRGTHCSEFLRAGIVRNHPADTADCIDSMRTIVYNTPPYLH